VLQTQTDTLITPPGFVLDSCRRIRAVTQIKPGLCVLVCVGDGLGDGECVREWLGDGDGLLDCDWDGLGLLLGDVLGLVVSLGLVVGAVESVGLADELVSVGEGLGLSDGEVVTAPPSRTAEVTASVPPPHGELTGRGEAANAGSIATPAAIKVTAAADTAARPARMTPARTTTLRSFHRHIPCAVVLTRAPGYPTV
jgi:hypothetical protein